MTERLLVVIHKNPNNPRQCVVSGSFAAFPGSTVVFMFNGQPNARIEFPGDPGNSGSVDCTPFGERTFSTQAMGPVGVAMQRVRDDAVTRSYGYTITWTDPAGDGLGGGGGEVLPRRG